MIAGQSTRQLYESLGPGRFAREVCHLLGVCDRQTGRRYTDPVSGNRQARAPRDSKGGELRRLSPREFSLRDLAESTLGPSWAERLSPDGLRQAALLEEQRPILEAAGTGAVQASHFADINAFTAVVSGLLEISLMEAWENPEYIADQLMPAEQTRMFDGRKVIGTTRLGDVAEPRLPGMPTKRAQFGERWITQPRTVENALSTEVTQEAVYLDLTGEVLQQANDVGEWLRWRKEVRVIDAFIGVVNTYSYKGTSYNTYLSNSTWNNDLASNELVDYTNLEVALIAFREMQDVETGLRVRIEPDRLLVNQGKLFTARQILGATEVETRAAGGMYPAQISGSGTTTNTAPIGIRKAPNPVAGLYGGSPLTSPLVYQRCTDASGLNLAASTAERYWWLWDSKRPPFKYAQNWPLRIQQAAPNQLDMIDRGVVLFVKADERGVPMVYEPRRIVRCKP